MNLDEEKVGRASQSIGNAPVPSAVQLRLTQARQAAIAQSTLPKTKGLGALALSLRYPKTMMAGLMLVFVLGAFWAQQRQVQSDAAIDIALLNSDVPMDMLLEANLAEAQAQ